MFLGGLYFVEGTRQSKHIEECVVKFLKAFSQHLIERTRTPFDRNLMSYQV